MKKVELTLVTCNVRYDGQANHPVPIPLTGTITYDRGISWLGNRWQERPWAERRSRLVDVIAAVGPSIIAFQEVLHTQLLDLKELLGPEYDHVGVGRDDGAEKGEYSPIFWNRLHLKYVAHQTKWLSKTPDVPGSKDWDASQTRIATFLTLKVIHSSPPEYINLINTHYDDGGIKSRGHASWIIREEGLNWVHRMEAQSRSKDTGVVILGDFNAPIHDKRETGYTNLVSSESLPNGSEGLFLADTRKEINLRGEGIAGRANGIKASAPSGPQGTYTGFEPPGCEVDERIDLVLLARQEENDAPDNEYSSTSKRSMDTNEAERDHQLVQSRIRGSWSVNQYNTLDNLIMGKGDETGWTGRWSDHRAIVVKISKGL